MCAHRRHTFLAAATGLMVLATKANAQVPSATPNPVGHGPLSVKTTYAQNGTTYMIHGVQVCLGTASNPVAYGGARGTDMTGVARFDNVPIGVPLYITVMSHPIWGGDVLQGTRVNYVAKAPGLVAVIPLVAGTSHSTPLCLHPHFGSPSGTDADPPAHVDTQARESAR